MVSAGAGKWSDLSEPVIAGKNHKYVRIQLQSGDGNAHEVMFSSSRSQIDFREVNNFIRSRSRNLSELVLQDHGGC